MTLSSVPPYTVFMSVMTPSSVYFLFSHHDSLNSQFSIFPIQLPSQYDVQFTTFPLSVTILLWILRSLWLSYSDPPCHSYLSNFHAIYDTSLLCHPWQPITRYLIPCYLWHLVHQTIYDQPLPRYSVHYTVYDHYITYDPSSLCHL